MKRPNIEGICKGYGPGGAIGTLREWIEHLESENKILFSEFEHARRGFGEAIRRPMGVVPAGYEDILQEDGKR
jgi:hypothetical protein